MVGTQLLIGFLFAGAMGVVAWQAKSLNSSGVWAAVFTGGLIFGLGGFAWALLLVVFFISSSLLSRMFKERKSSLGEKFEKGSKRDWGQVFANGGFGTILVITHTVLPGQSWPWIAYAGAMATVTADTWATEIGVLSRAAPRLISTGRVVERGASGGVTNLGTMATIAGGLLIGLLAGAISSDGSLLTNTALVGLAGLAGSLLDSALGATVQAIYYCPHDNKETEQHPLHRCGRLTTLSRGWHWLNNDLVNFISSVFGGGVAVGIWLLLA
jgi:uncharacterized protein (TIGR00297 family)